jgi:hypothetical protein
MKRKSVTCATAVSLGSARTRGQRCSPGVQRGLAGALSRGRRYEVLAIACDFFSRTVRIVPMAGMKSDIWSGSANTDS